jgi:hypothetical protein
MSSNLKLPVAVIMQRKLVRQGPWTVPSWDALAVLPAESLPSGTARRELLREDEETQQFLWRGFHLPLYRDAAESYWYNLVGDNPSIYVLCHENPDGEPEPFSITANQDEASAGIEGDDGVYSTPIAAEIYPTIERFVVENFKPREPKIRKRKNWSQEPDK